MLYGVILRRLHPPRGTRAGECGVWPVVREMKAVEQEKSAGAKDAPDLDVPDEVIADYCDEIDEVPVERVEVWIIGTADGGHPVDENERLAECEKALGYAFADRRLLARALTHSSSTSDKHQDNERLEFFGDAVLDLVVREYLFHHFPNRQEGDLTEAKSAIVCRASLVKAARDLGLKRFLILGRGMGQRKGFPESLIADAYEAVVAAVYLDGGYPPARDFIMRTLGDVMPQAVERANATNFKSNLQKLTQQGKRPLPIYRLLGASGPEHSRTFAVAVLVDGREMGRGSGTSKKAAEQEAAKSALENIAAGED